MDGLGVPEEEILRTRLRDLMTYRSLGLKTIDECFQHENVEQPSTRKRSASVCEAGPSGMVPENPRIHAPASEDDQATSPQDSCPNSEFRKADYVRICS